MYKARSGRNNHRILIVTFWVIWLAASVYLLITFLNPFFGRLPAQSLTSLDWAGYSVTSDQTSPQTVVTGVNGSWTVPRVTVSQNDTFSAIWIGIGGQLDRTLIQIGTEQDSINGTEEYSAWYELLPDFSVTIDAINVSYGDQITAAITLVDSTADEWALEIVDTTKQQQFQQNVQYVSSRLSAEWIVERPTVDHSISTLADFGSVTITAASATIRDRIGSVKDFPYAQIIMEDSQNVQLATVSQLSSNGSSFKVTYSGPAVAQSYFHESSRISIATAQENDLAGRTCLLECERENSRLIHTITGELWLSQKRTLCFH